MLTNAQLIRELAKPGKVFMPVLMANDVCHMAVEKAYLIGVLKDQQPDDPAWWCFFGGDYGPGTDRYLDVQD
jgi:hypothetical protein